MPHCPDATNLTPAGRGCGDRGTCCLVKAGQPIWSPSTSHLRYVGYRACGSFRLQAPASRPPSAAPGLFEASPCGGGRAAGPAGRRRYPVYRPGPEARSGDRGRLLPGSLAGHPQNPMIFTVPGLWAKRLGSLAPVRILRAPTELRGLSLPDGMPPAAGLSPGGAMSPRTRGGCWFARVPARQGGRVDAAVTPRAFDPSGGGPARPFDGTPR